MSKFLEKQYFPIKMDDDQDSTSNVSTGENSDHEEYVPFDTSEVDQEARNPYSSVKLATTNCLHAYAIARMKGAEDYSIPWPPLMLIVLNYLNNKYERRELVTERNIAMLELLLKVPIQLKIEHGIIDKYIIDLNDDNSIDFSGMSFVEAIEIAKNLIQKKTIKIENIRTPVHLFLSGP